MGAELGGCERDGESVGTARLALRIHCCFVAVVSGGAFDDGALTRGTAHVEVYVDGVRPSDIAGPAEHFPIGYSVDIPFYLLVRVRL